MPLNTYSSTARDGDLVQLVGLRHKHFIFNLLAGAKFETHRGVLQHDDLIGKAWGTQVFSHLGAPFFLLQPSLADLLTNLPRTTQIMYPKDIGFILVTMGVGPGQTVMEAGSGSGSMTTALAYAIGAEGRVVSYEVRPDMQNLARKNLARFGLDSRVDFKLRDIGEGFDETDADSFFLDVPNPYDYIGQVRAALKPGGFFCSLSPTFNQIEKTLHTLRQHNFAFLEVCEILLRYFKPEPSRLRPTDRMVAHTGFLVFGRKIEPTIDPRGRELNEEIEKGDV
ncbi:MAG TPA: tRNA (adenine-N1)-methyltransferase [Anaerolineales bacterium]|jgi:tRNA (adenine57-N1/adenine58-N1)-methyltransferase|nr:tRNA (adenine-N1)-methyltransferase [Anaerolineales bacterium]HQX16291.1 tRNA (adenine-N1)-methyltransferase [Anaerolineales bacterium]